MKYSQRDLVRLTQPMPLGQQNNHPFLIISCESSNSKGDYYTGIMMTTSPYTDLYTFKITNDMFEGSLSKTDNQLRLYIIVSFKESFIKEKINRMHKIHFKQVVKQICDYIFSVDN